MRRWAAHSPEMEPDVLNPQRPPRCRACLLALAVLPLALGMAARPAAAEPAPQPWEVAGRQGIILQVIVPTAQAGDREAYRVQVEKLCAGKETCFVNFFTNSTGAAPSVPLPEAITSEATAVLRRSGKNGVEGFRWSCRLALPEPDCF